MSLSRRHLFRAVPGLFAVGAVSAAPPPVVLTFAIAGGHYHALDAALPALRRHQSLVLRRERENPHDRFAIAVLRSDGTKLGYVPRSSNQTLARLLDAGWRTSARIADFIDPPVHRADVAFTSMRKGDPLVEVTIR